MSSPRHDLGTAVPRDDELPRERTPERFGFRLFLGTKFCKTRRSPRWKPEQRSGSIGIYGLLSQHAPHVGIPLRFLLKQGRLPNLAAPATFNEKLCAAKLQWRQHNLSDYVDKIKAKVIVAKELGDSWVIPTLYSGRRLPAIADRNWGEPFVVKANHGSNMNLFVKDSSDVDWRRVDAKVEHWLRRTHGRANGEFPYWQVDRKVLVEPLLGNGQTLDDFKIYVFGGKAQFIQVDRDRFGNHQRSFYDRQWRKQRFALKHPLDPNPVPRPSRFHEMLEAAEHLARPFPFLRVDLYEVATEPFFGEMTFFPEGGNGRFSSSEVDRMFGRLWPHAEEPSRLAQKRLVA